MTMTTGRITPPPMYNSAQPISQPSSTLNPYLSLSHILSLTWLAYPILSLLFIAFRLQLSSASAQDAVNDAKSNLLTSCKAAEQAATAAASLPRYMAVATNDQISDAVNGTMNAARATLVLALTIMEAIINFIIDIYRSTFLCFLELVVRGGLSLLIGAVQEISSFIQSTMSSIRTSIQNDVATANSAISTAIGAINKINPFGNITVPQFSIPSLTSLENVTIPTDFEDTLVKLNNSLPTLDQLKDSITDFVDTPFELLKKDINDTFAGLSFNSSTLPVPQQNNLAFCGDMDTSVVDNLGHDLLQLTKIGIIICVGFAVLLVAAHCALEWYKWRCMQNHLEYTRQAWMSDPTLIHNNTTNSPTPSLQMTDHNLRILSASSSHPLLTRISNQISALMSLTPRQHTHLTWFFHYVFHPPAMACFLIGLLGILSVQLQLLAIGPLEAKYTQQVAASTTDFSKTIASSINASMYNQSAAYANDINTQLNSTQSSINDGLFGWVNGTTTTLNDTLNTFYDDIQNAVTTVFNNTILESPVQEFVRCIIGSKIEAFEKVLTFLHDNLHVDLPVVNDSVLVLSPADVNEAVQPISRAAVGSGDGQDQGLVGKLVNRYVESLKLERLMFAIFLGLWLIVVLMALSIIAYHSYVLPSMEARRKRKWEESQRSFIEPYSSEKQFTNEWDVERRTPSTENLQTPMSQTRTGPAPWETESSSNNSSSSSQRPGLERSWDSFVDSSEIQPSNKRASARTSRKLVGIGRKAMGRERFVSDEERAQMDASDVTGGDVETSQPSGWWNKTFSIFKKRETTPEVEVEPTPSPPSVPPLPPRNKANLTIRTSMKPSEFQTPTKTPTKTPDVPGSAWSVSPAPPRRLPWMIHPTHTVTKRPSISPPQAIRPKPRRNASVPQSVLMNEQPSYVLPHPQVSGGLNVSYPNPGDSTNPFIDDYHMRSSSVYPMTPRVQPLFSPRPTVDRDLVAPFEYQPDPFRTPFDDEARIPRSARRSRGFSVSTPITSHAVAI